MQTPLPEKEPFRRFLIYFFSWNFFLDAVCAALLIWFASFIDDTERVTGHHLLIFGMCVLATLRSIYYFIVMIVKIFGKKWKQAFFVLAGFFVQLVILAGFYFCFFYVIVAASLAIGPLE